MSFFSKSTQVGISSKQTAKVLMNYCIWIYTYIYIYMIVICGLAVYHVFITLGQYTTQSIVQFIVFFVTA